VPFGTGTRLGKYEILKRLAIGGMAEIYLARVNGLPGFQKMFVVKRILPELATRPDFIEMFLDEARIAATLEHSNVVQMYDVGVVDGNYFIAMEYLHGEDVRSITRAVAPSSADGRLPLHHALNIVKGVAAGLHYAHEKTGFDNRPLQIVHRDVNPQNVIVTYEGAIKLLDFGIAKASNRFGETRFGTLKGKVPYMSPEQCRGEALDRRSDVFSLGIMLYELTVGRRLYKGKSDFEVLKQIVEGPVRLPHELDPSFPPALEAIILRALEKRPADRFQTARQMQLEIEAFVRDHQLQVTPESLKQFMQTVFAAKIEAWRAAQARGQSLSEHLQTMTAPSTSTDLEPLVEIVAGRPGSPLANTTAETDTHPPPRMAPLHPTPAMAPLHPTPATVAVAASIVAARSRRRSLHQRLQEHTPLLVAVALSLLGVIAGSFTWYARQAHRARVLQPAGVASLEIATSPPGASVRLDGRSLANVTPVRLDGVAAGEHVLAVSLAGYQDSVVRITLSPGEARPLSLTLARQ
jgi:serine/threonine protein kinase